MSLLVCDEVTTLRDLTRVLAAETSFATVVAALQRGESATIDGAWGSTKALAIAAITTGKPELLVVVAPRPGEVEPMVADLRAFGGGVPAVLPVLPDWGERGQRVDEAYGERLAVLKTLVGASPPALVVTTMQAFLQPVPSRAAIRAHSRVLQVRQIAPCAEFTAWLDLHAWRRCEAVELPGEYSVRGGILDLFPLDALHPVRVDYFGDEVDSLREFDVASQRSLRELDRVEITALAPASAPVARPPRNARISAENNMVCFADTVPRDTWFVLLEPLELQQEGNQYRARMTDTQGLLSVEEVWESLYRRPTVVISSLPYATMETRCTLRVESVEQLSGGINPLSQQLDRITQGERVLFVCDTQAEIERLREVLHTSTVAREGRLHFPLGHLTTGFRFFPNLETAGVMALSAGELFQREETRASTNAAPRRRLQSRAIDSFVELAAGDYVVHLSHGIAIYRGMKMLEKSAMHEEHLILEFADNQILYVPASRIALVQKYVGGSSAGPRLARVGGSSWERSKDAAQRAVIDLAAQLLDLQAARQASTGMAFPAESDWMRQFEAAFPYEETPDQLTAWQEVRVDMETARAMDRLICGDVGYGKTEVAMRAAFKAVDAGKQVAVLVPTTILAEQHLRTFRARMAEFPFTVEVLSRFQTRAEQRDVLKRLASGGVDVLIGTHRLLSKDIRFQDLGLVVIDEEQRFGVDHKERLKRLRTQVDVLTLSATPIPRTLHFALVGLRDISNLETPPQERLAVETRVSRFDPDLIRHALVREMNRDGQVYFVHNRIEDMEQIGKRLRGIVPEARIVKIHGRMDEEEIEDAMLRFIERRADVLLATTIIESGLDIPNANTIFIDDADRYGLADLHQLRGRVGRSRQRAYCYLLVDEHKIVTPDAQRRLRAIEEFSTLGAGFKIALRDLEIRGAGNLLGREQSGHIAAIGYELYCQLLENAVRTQRKLPLRTFLDVTIELPWKAFFPHDYLPGERHRVDAYRRLARIENLDELKEFRRELKDRFGLLPRPAENLVQLAELRLMAQVWQIESIRPDEKGNLAIIYRDRARMGTLAKLRSQDILLLDERRAYLRPPVYQHHADDYCKILHRVLQP